MKVLLWTVMISVLGFPATGILANVQPDSFNRNPDRMRLSSELLRVASGICPQPRKTEKAPSRYLRKQNPLSASAENVERGKALYQKEAKPVACSKCHGIRGNGNGSLARKLVPAPRNFTCEKTMKSLSDGQLFWVIKTGSRGTAMPAHRLTLSDKDIWRIIYYLKGFAR